MNIRPTFIIQDEDEAEQPTPNLLLFNHSLVTDRSNPVPSLSNSSTSALSPLRNRTKRIITTPNASSPKRVRQLNQSVQVLNGIQNNVQTVSASFLNHNAPTQPIDFDFLFPNHNAPTQPNGWNALYSFNDAATIPLDINLLPVQPEVVEIENVFFFNVDGCCYKTKPQNQGAA